MRFETFEEIMSYAIQKEKEAASFPETLLDDYLAGIGD